MKGNWINTKIEMDWDGNVLYREGYEWFGGTAQCKGDDVAKQQEQQQLAFNQQLSSIFQQQFAQQSAVLQFLKGKLEPLIDNPTGYDPVALSAMRTGATDAISQQYQNAQKALNNQLNSKNGGSDLPSGVDAQIQGGFQQSQAQDQANAQNTITLNDANLKNTNMWNAFNVLSGNVASQFNPLGYAGAYNQGSGTVANLSQAYTNSRQSGLLGALGGVTGSLLGAAGNAGGFGSLFCWVAASFFGWNSEKTCHIRLWMLAKAPGWFRNFYINHGEWIASTPLRWAFRPLFEAVLWSY